MNGALRPSLRHPGILIATWFGSGYLRPAPGTWGTLAALPFAWLILHYGDWRWLLAASILLFPVGVWAASVYSAQSGTQDAGAIVVDEVVAMWLTLAILWPLGLDQTGWIIWPAAFLAFRLMDIAKPWPVSLADAKVKGGLGVMLDDVLAAIYAVILVLLGKGIVQWLA